MRSSFERMVGHVDMVQLGCLYSMHTNRAWHPDYMTLLHLHETHRIHHIQHTRTTFMADQATKYSNRS